MLLNLRVFSVWVGVTELLEPVNQINPWVFGVLKDLRGLEMQQDLTGVSPAAINLLSGLIFVIFPRSLHGITLNSGVNTQINPLNPLIPAAGGSITLLSLDFSCWETLGLCPRFFRCCSIL